MTKNEAFKNEIESCRTQKEIYKVLKKHNKPVVKNDSKEVGCFSIWISETERIYKSYRGMIFQTWRKERFEYSGIPVFFG